MNRTNLFRIGVLSTVIFSVLFMMHFPTLYAYLKTPSGYAFTGNNAWFDPWDINVYVAAIRWGQQGHFLLKNLYTTQNLPPTLMYPLYTSVGFVFRWADPYVLFTATAVVIGSALCVSTYMLSRYFFADSFLKRVVFLLLVFLGGGFSWLISWDGIPDSWFTGFTYHAALQRGHEGLGVLSYTVFYIVLFVSITRGFSMKRTTLFLLSYFIALLTYPYMYAHFALTCVFFYLGFPHLWNKKIMAIFLLLLVLGGLESGLYFIHLKQSSIEIVLSKANILPLLLGYGLFIVTFLYTLLYMRKNEWVRFFIIWIVAGWLLSYAPVGISRFFLRGLYFPMAALTIVAIDDCVHRYKIKKSFLLIVFISFSLLTSISQFHMRLLNVSHYNYWVYLPLEESEAIMYLRTQKNAYVLSEYLVSNHIPAWTDASVYMGHRLQTPQAKEKASKVKQFYSGTWNSNKARIFLRNNHITHVYYGMSEQLSGVRPSGTIAPYPFLKPIYNKGGVTIYRVT